MPRPPLAIALLAFALAAPAPAAAATFFSQSVTRVAANLYQAPGGELIQTLSCTRPATAMPALIRIDPVAGPVIGRIDFGGGSACDVAAVYAPYADAPEGTYGAILTRLEPGYYADTTVAPHWIVRGAPACPAANARLAHMTLATAGPTFVPPGTPIGALAFDPGPGEVTCDLVGVFGQVDLNAIPSLRLVVTRDGAGTGTVADDWGVIDCGTACQDDFGPGAAITLRAAPSPGSVFAGWSGACSGTGPCQVTIASAIAVTATFLVEAPASFPLSVTKSGLGTGSVISSPGAIACGAACSANFAANATVQLAATPDAGSRFAGWGGACSGMDPQGCSVTLDAAKSVSAAFEIIAPVTHELSVTKLGGGSGSVASTPAGIACGATCAAAFEAGRVVTLTAQADTGSVFAGWSGGGCSGTGACQVTLDAAKSVTATFANAAPALFRLAVTRAGSGAVNSACARIACGDDCHADLAARTVVTLAATPSPGFVFSGWSGACTGTAACQVTMNAAQAVTAHFSAAPPPTFDLTVATAGGGEGTVASSTPGGIACGAACSRSFDGGTVVSLTATPAAGSFFAGWSGACTGKGACDVTMSAARNVTAIFKLVTTIPRLANISTRMQVLTGADVLIGGFIIGGNEAKTVVVRARGPSLEPFGVANALANPRMDLYAGQSVIATNDDWGSAANAAAIQASGFAPSSALESAILVTLNPGAYTAVVSGAGNATGVGIIEVFEVDKPEVPLANISTRGRVLTGGDVMIGGFIIQGDSPQTVVVRARGPSLAPFGIASALGDTVLQLYSGQALLASNDDWGTGPDAAMVQSSGFAPSDARESVIRVTLPPGAYTAIVSGKNGATGVGIIEVFAQ